MIRHSWRTPFVACLTRKKRDRPEPPRVASGRSNSPGSGLASKRQPFIEPWRPDTGSIRAPILPDPFGDGIDPICDRAEEHAPPLVLFASRPCHCGVWLASTRLAVVDSAVLFSR